MGKLNKLLKNKKKKISVIYISSFVPRKCGIATYTRDLTSAIRLVSPYSGVEIIAMVKPDDNIDYPPEVRLKIRQDRIGSYIRAADYINKSKADLVVLEHEFGLYGGEYGAYILKLVERLKKPLILTAHTIPYDSKRGYGPVLKDIITFAEKVVIMMPESLSRLIKKYGCPGGKIEIIPHGVPDIPMEPTEKYKKKKGLAGRIILGNINLLSEVKGIEYTIEALKKIKAYFPDVLYLIIGQTHPVVLQKEGEKYRDFLKEKIRQDNLRENTRFINEYVSLDELIGWLKIIDIYITPYLDPQQSASGALAYAIGAGKICISTPYLYAKNILSKGRGIIVPFRDSGAIADAVIDVCNDPLKKAGIEKKAYKFGRLMTWYNVALQHIELFNRVIAGDSEKDRIA